MSSFRKLINSRANAARGPKESGNTTIPPAHHALEQVAACPTQEVETRNFHKRSHFRFSLPAPSPPLATGPLPRLPVRNQAALTRIGFVFSPEREPLRPPATLASAARVRALYPTAPGRAGEYDGSGDSSVL